MNNHFAGTRRKRTLSVALATVIAASSLSGAVFAEADVESALAAVEEAAATEESVINEAGEEYSINPLLSADTDFIQVEEDGASMDAEITLKSVDTEINGVVSAENITLGGAFRNMEVSKVDNDESSITLTVSGVPDLTRDNWVIPLYGTMEFAGDCFGMEEPLTASVVVEEPYVDESHAKPIFWPYFDAMIDNSDTFEMHIVLLPMSGRFAEDFSKDDVAFGEELASAELTSFKESDIYYEIMASVPKKELAEDEDSYSYTGTITLAEGSMVNLAGEESEEICITRKYAPENVGRDLSDADISTLKGIVGGFGNTTWGTIGGVLSTGGSLFSAGYTVLGLFGVVPSDASRHAEIMNQLTEIKKTVDRIDVNVDYMRGLLDAHTVKLNEIGIQLDENRLGEFNTVFGDMVETMDKIEKELQKPQNVKLIEEAMIELGEPYRIPAEGSDREMDFDELSSGDELSGGYPSVEEAPAPAEVNPAPAEVQTVPTDETAVPEGEDEILPEEGQTEEALGTEEADLLSDGGEAELQEGPEDLWTYRDLEDDEVLPYLLALDQRIQAIPVTTKIKIGDYIGDLIADYKIVIQAIKDNTSFNPINAYCNLHTKTDNFSTTSLDFEILYEMQIKYQLERAINMLMILDGVEGHYDKKETLENHTYLPDLAKLAVDENGYPFCNLMGCYVGLSGDITKTIYEPMQKKKMASYSVLDNTKAETFRIRMRGRTLAEELKQAKIPGLDTYMNTYTSFDDLWNDPDYPGNAKYAGIGFSFERWGATWGEQVVDYSHYRYHFEKDLYPKGKGDNYKVFGEKYQGYYGYSEYKDAFWIVSPKGLLWSDAMEMNGGFVDGILQAKYAGNEKEVVNDWKIQAVSSDYESEYHYYVYAPLMYLKAMSKKIV